MSKHEPHVYQPFMTTHWSLVERAGRDGGAATKDALAALLRQYLPALRSHLVVHKRVPSHDADDLLQGFLAGKVIERDLVGRADRSRGKFRTFLLTALDRYVLNENRNRQAAKRDASRTVPLGEEHDRRDESAPPGAAFEVEWARQVLRQAIDATRRECEKTGRPDVWGVFQARTLQPILHHQEPVPYPALVERFGFASPAQASNVLITANRMFARNLRAVVAAYEFEEGDVDREIAELRSVLARVPLAAD